MNKKIIDCLSGNHGSYILPFLWLHGESHERLREEILAIKNSGIREFCAESRPYDAFCQDVWWEDFGFILKTAKELGMRVWLLDDRKFPTGYANGYLEDPSRAHLRKRVAREYQIDVVGPMKYAKVNIVPHFQSSEDTVIRVVAYRRTEAKEELDFQSAIDLTDRLSDGMVYWDIPEGVWRVCAVAEGRVPFPRNDRSSYYVDMLNPDSCHAMIDAVYQPHYDHFSEYFGNTFAGFFSDEPGFLNHRGSYHNRLGMMQQSYPWSQKLPALIAESAGVDVDTVNLYLPALWEDLGEITALIRMHYMEVVTKEYSKNFGYLLGDWCREHGVLYIGHVIEDRGAHMRLGYGSGHFFRALDGQDMAGIDIVLLQDVPGFTDHIHKAHIADGGIAEPDFFRYTLPKLASSHAHIQPLKQGRAMCEIFGAFGWAEGLPYMKKLTDSMLIGGINHFVPHAFSPKEEDPDCPPHFYNGGKNIQYPLFKNLMDYMGRCSHLLFGGTHHADVAVFYNAEGEWTGGKNQMFHSICKTLSRHLIDFDILPFDALRNAKVEGNKLVIGKESYGALILSESEILPYDRLSCFGALSDQGLPVIFTDALPRRSAEQKDISELLPKFRSIPFSELCPHLRERGLCHIDGTGEGLSHLRFYHVSKENTHIYAFSNEAIYGNVDARLSLPNQGPCLIYEPWDNRLYRSDAKDGTFSLKLEKANLLFLIFGEEVSAELPVFTHECHRIPLPMSFEIAVKEEEDTDFRVIAGQSAPFDLSAPDRIPDFSGKIRYRAEFTAADGYTVLDLGDVGEVAEVWLNGQQVGVRIDAPYKFDLRPALRSGTNHIEILVTSNLGHRRRDRFSAFIQIPPSGLIGPLSLCRYEA